MDEPSAARRMIDRATESARSQDHYQINEFGLPEMRHKVHTAWVPPSEALAAPASASEPVGAADAARPAKVRAPGDRPPSPSRAAAHASYVRALDSNPELKGAPMKAVYKWLQEHDPHPDYELPKRCSTWERYVREHRKHLEGGPRNTTRAGRVGRSVVRHDQV